MTTNTIDSNPATSAYDALNTKTSTAAANPNSMTATEDRFLKLLVTQLKNQDPLNPLDNAQVTSQMAQISTVNGIEKLNTTLKALMSNSNDAQSMQAAALVGHGVLVPGTGLAFKAADGKAFGGVELTAPADKVTVNINDANGITVRTLDLGGLETGSHPFQWDGKTTSGAQVADGPYTFSVSAVRGSATVDSKALQLGMVNSIMSSSQGIGLNVGSLGVFKMADVREIL